MNNVEEESNKCDISSDHRGGSNPTVHPHSTAASVCQQIPLLTAIFWLVTRAARNTNEEQQPSVANASPEPQTGN